MKPNNQPHKKQNVEKNSPPTKARWRRSRGSEKETPSSPSLRGETFILPLQHYHHTLVSLESPLVYFGDRSWRDVKGEWLEEGDTPSILPGDPVEEPMLLRLPSSSSGLGQELYRWDTSVDNMVVVP